MTVEELVHKVGPKSREFLPTLASIWALGHTIDVRSLVNALLGARVECPELYEIDSDRLATNEELRPRLGVVLAQLGQGVPDQSRALIQLVRCFATVADKKGQDLAEFALETHWVWFDPYSEPPGALDFIWDLYSVDAWPPQQSWEIDSASFARQRLRRLIELSVDELLLPETG